MKYFSKVAKALIRFFVLWLVDGVSLLLAAAVYSGLAFQDDSLAGRLSAAFAAAFLLGVVNLLIRPLVLLLARPLGFVAVFLIGFLVNGLALLVTSWLLPTFEVTSLFAAIVGGLLFSAINVVLTGVLEIHDEGSFYQSLIERMAKRQSLVDQDPGKRGIVMLEIDGLSYHHLKKALDEGHMPEMQQMISEEGYELSRVDCGIPSQTSACQAGILFGDNDDIPAFRWFDKDEQKLYVSGSDATLLNRRYATGNGLLRGGSSINNMLNGDASKSLLTAAGLFEADAEEKKRRAEDVYLLMLNPYFLTRTIVLFLVDVVREVWQGWRQRRQGVEPRLNRLAHGYPFVRAATTVFMRDISANLTILDIIRGAPSIYVTWPGYDEVAHHSGPWTDDAFKVLATYDQVIRRVRETIKDKAPRPYDLIILSDHGQSFGPTFKQRYGLTLKEFIEQQLPQDVTVAQSMGGDTGMTSLTAVSGELSNIQETGVGGATGRAVARRGRKLIDDSAKQREIAEGTIAEGEMAQVTAYGSGNLAQVYFDLYPRKILISELNEAYPGMVDALVQHEGIGLVCGYDDDGTPIAFGKQGTRNLHTGEITGADPLEMYAPDAPGAHGASTVETRAWQVQRVMDFAHAGDLMVISTVYPDGSVAALEELIGNHGGLGGEQTDAFLFHPPDVHVVETRNAIDVFHILNSRRGIPVTEVDMAPQTAVAPQVDVWSFANLWAGLKDVKTWLRYALHAVVLDRATYRDVTRDGRMTGPALLLGFGLAALSGYLRAEPGAELLGVASRMVSWPLAVLGVFLTGRWLTQKGTYTRTLRGMGFAQATHLIDVLLLVPAIAPVITFLSSVLTILAVWMAAAEAHETRGWRTAILPFLAIIIILAIPLVVLFLTGSAVMGITEVLQQFGLMPPAP